VEKGERGMSFSDLATRAAAAPSDDDGGEGRGRLVERVDARPAGEPVACCSPPGLVHRLEDAALEVEVRAGVEAGVTHRPHRLVEDHVTIRAALQAGHAVALEEGLAVDVVAVLEKAVDGALPGAPEVGERPRVRL